MQIDAIPAAIPYFINNPNMTLSFQFRGKETAPKAIYSPYLDVFINYYTVIILIDKGELVDVGKYLNQSLFALTTFHCVP